MNTPIVNGGGLRPRNNGNDPTPAQPSNPTTAHPQNPATINVPVSNGNYIPIMVPGIPSGFITVPIPNVPVSVPVTLPPPPTETIVKVTKKDGCTCKKCKEYYEFAVPNQPDDTLVCWSCRHGY